MIAWHIYPLGFAGLPIREDQTGPNAPHRPDGIGQPFEHLANWLEYAAALGFEALSLGPIFESQTHGYDTLDHYRIDRRLGTDAEFAHFVDQAHQYGLKIYLDGVFNHVGERHRLHLAATAPGPAGDAARRFFRWDGHRAAAFEGHQSLVTLNHSDEAVATFVKAVMAYWLERGVDGWRLDAAYATGPDFWRHVLPDLRERFVGAYFFGELLHGDGADFVKRSTMDSVTQYELWKAIWSSIKDRNFFELDWCVSRHNQLLESYSPVTFIGNHDVTRIASQVGQAGAEVALAALMSLGGTPHIYYGDEQGFTGVKEDRLGGDDAVRPAFPATPSDLAPWGWETHERHRRLIHWRRANPWLARATTERLELTNTRYVYRTAGGGQSVITRLDLTDPDRPSAQIEAPDLDLGHR
jgi:glycosidase